MKRYLIIQMCQAALGLSAIASPFATDPATEVVVYSPSSTSPLHVSTISTNPMDSVISSAFPSSYTGHRAVCQIKRATTNDDFCAWIGGGSYNLGDPFGVSSGRAEKQIELTDTSSIVPRVKIWGESVSTMSDRAKIYGEKASKDIYVTSNRFVDTYIKNNQDSVRVRIVRYKVDGIPNYKLGVDASVLIDKDFIKTTGDFIHEGYFLKDGDIDIDWKNFYDDVVDWWGVWAAQCVVTNVSYLIVYGNGPIKYLDDDDTNTVITASPTLINRRFEKTRTIPTPVLANSLASSTIFSFRIVGEDPWASMFGTTYTAFKVKVMNGSTEVWNSGIRRLPARDKNGVYKFQTFQTFQNPQTLTWRVAVYNSKFKTDTLMELSSGELTPGDPFSTAKPITVIGD